MTDRLLAVLAALLAALVIGLAVFWKPSVQTATEQPVATLPAGGPFTLESASGPVSLKAFEGRLVLLYFGYTYCPDICPTSLAATSEGVKRLTAEEAAQVGLVFISVDPERDTPARLKTYVEFFHPALQGLSGQPAQIDEIARRYGVVYHRQAAETPGGPYVIDHSADTFLLGRQGEVLARIPHGTAPNAVRDLVRYYLSLNPKEKS